MRTAFLLIGVMMIGQQQPPNRPPPNAPVTDPARPDFGYPRAWTGSELTIAIVLSADCTDCVDSVSFYKRLTELAVLDGNARRIAFLTEGGVWPVIEMIEKHAQGFKPRNVVSYPGSDWFRTRVFPSVYVVDGKWQRRGEWAGRLTPAQEKDVIALVERVAKEGRK